MKFHSALKREISAPPVWFMRQAGRYHKHYQNLRKNYSFVDLCKTPELAAETALGPIQDFDFDVAILFSDILFPLEALGMGLSYADGPPKLGYSLSSEKISELWPLEKACPLLNFQGESMRATRAVLPSNKSLIGFIGGPWTLYVYAVEGGHHGSLVKSKKGIFDLFPAFCERLLPLLAYTIEKQLAGGAEIVMIFDTAAGELAPELYQRAVGPSLEYLSQRFPGKLGFYGKNMCEGHLEQKILQSTNFAGIGVDHRMNLPAILKSRKHGFVQGNFDQSFLHLEKEKFESEARRYLETMRALGSENRRGWVAGLGHGVLPQTPEANVRRYVELVREIL